VIVQFRIIAIYSSDYKAITQGFIGKLKAILLSQLGIIGFMSLLKQKKLSIGLIINPWAGIGGSVALKGSDGEDIREKALSLGAKPKAQCRVEQALQPLLPFRNQLKFLTVAGDMGETVLEKFGFNYNTILTPQKQTRAEDTKTAVARLEKNEVDLIVFAGGDGTARDIYDGLTQNTLVLGIPAGTKIHSGVYCITPTAAGELIAQVVEGKVVEIANASVMDIDEVLFRQGKVQAKLYGQLRIPFAPLLVQQVKSGSQVDESINQQEIAAGICQELEDDHLYIMGSGSTIASVMAELQLENTLLGVDVVLNQQVIAKDVRAEQLEDFLRQHGNLPRTLYVTVIGGQGHVFGRGNQQLSQAAIRLIGKSNIHIVATKEKMEALHGRPFISDTGDVEFDHWLAGRYKVQVDYNETWLYPLA